MIGIIVTFSIILSNTPGGAVMLEELYRQLGEGGAPPDIVPAVGSQERRLSRLLRGGTPAARSLRWGEGCTYFRVWSVYWDGAQNK